MGNKKGGGGGGGSEIHPSQEYQKIFNIFQKQVVPGYRKFARQERLIKPLAPLAEQGIAELPGQQAALTAGYEAGAQDIPQARQWLQEAYGSRVPVEQLTSPLMAALNAPGGAAEISASGGALTPQLGRLADQQALSLASRAGMGTTQPGLASAYLNRDIFRQKRYGDAVTQALGLTSGVSGLDTQALNNAIGAGGALQGYGAAEFQRPLQYALGQQGLRGTVMQDLAAAEQAQIGAFGGLFNPTAAGVGSMIGFNANAAAARENAQSQKKGNTTGAVIGAVGTVAAAY
jgi:hypothetical protein